MTPRFDKSHHSSTVYVLYSNLYLFGKESKMEKSIINTFHNMNLGVCYEYKIIHNKYSVNIYSVYIHNKYNSVLLSFNVLCNTIIY